MLSEQRSVNVLRVDLISGGTNALAHSHSPLIVPPDLALFLWKAV